MPQPLKPHRETFHTDRAECWPRGLLPKLRPRPHDPDAPPAPCRPGVGYSCTFEALLDRLTPEQAERVQACRGAVARMLVTFLTDDEPMPSRGVRLQTLVGGEMITVRYPDPEIGRIVEHFEWSIVRVRIEPLPTATGA